LFAQALVHMLERVEALEARPIPSGVELAAPTPEAAPVATDQELCNACNRGRRRCGFGPALRSVYDLGRQHGAAQPAPPPAPAGELVGMVGEAMERDYVIADIEGTWDAQARAAIREVAAWLDQQCQHGCSLLLREEADR
jgi:hypothetical protein